MIKTNILLSDINSVFASFIGQITVSIPGPEGDNESISAGGVPIFSTVIRSG